MADATLADKLHLSLSPQDLKAPLPVEPALSSFDPPWLLSSSIWKVVKPLSMMPSGKIWKRRSREYNK
eukprot:4107888-Prorocentrum_lima.AAC.1